MCLAIPGKVIEVNGDNAVVDYSGEKREVKNYLGVNLGDWVIVSNKIIVVKVPEAQVKKYVDSIKNARENAE